MAKRGLLSTRKGVAMTTMSSRGQVTIPKEMRKALGLKPGSKIVFEIGPSGELVMRRPGRPAKPNFDKVRGILKSDQTTDEIIAELRGRD